MRQGTSAGDITNKRNCRTIFADYVRQREAAQLGLRSPVQVQAFVNPATAYQTVIEGASYTTTSEYNSYIDEVTSTSVVPSVSVPDAPSGVTGTSGNNQVEVSFVTPANNGGSAIITYTVTASPGGRTATGASSPLTVYGLINGTSYTFTVIATNAIGNSLPSPASLGIVPATIPDAIQNGVITPGNGQITVTFTGIYDGGSPITNFMYSLNYGAYIMFDPAITSSPLVITGLENGTSYRVGIAALNAVNASGISYNASVFAPVTPSTVPSDPIGLMATPGNNQVQISFIAPSNGGSPITNYQYSINDGVSYTAFSPAKTSSPVTITGLVNGTTYTIRLKAVNANGPGLESGSITVTPNIAPAAPIIQYILAGNSKAYVYVTAGAGGGSVTNYEYTTDNGASYRAVNPAAITSPITVTGLANGSSTTIGVRAVNNIDNSAVSNYVSVTPVDPSAASPLLYYDPSNASSYSGTGNTVTSIGSAAATGTKAAAVVYNAAIKSGVFDFPGTAGAVISFGSYNFGNSISVTAWIYPRLQNNINGLFTNAGANVPTNGFKFQWNFWLNSSRAISFQAGNGTTGGDDFTPNNTLTYDTWQHVGYVFDKTNQKVIFFLNGQPTLVATDVTTVENINTNAAFNIGGYIGGSYTMNAQLGYIKIFNTLLNATQVEADYNNSVARFA